MKHSWLKRVAHGEDRLRIAHWFWMIGFLPLIVCLIGLLLTGCSTISGNLAADALKSSGAFGTTVRQGLLDASSNLDQGVKVGALDATDPAPGCLHSVLRDLGIDPNLPVQGPGTSFTPVVSDFFSEGSVLYIRARQVQKLQATGVKTTPECKAFIGQIMIDAAGAGLKLPPGGGFAVPLR
jgi:hypothetical protein